MYSLIDNVPSIPEHYVVAAERVNSVKVPLAGGNGVDVLYPVVMTTAGEPDCDVLVKRYCGTDAAAIARREVALLLRVAHENVLGVVGLVVVNPYESYVLLEHHKTNSSSTNPLTRTEVDSIRAQLGPDAFVRQVLQWALDVAAGLAHLHANDVYHLGIQASNILLCGGTAKINACGVASRLGGLCTS